jgi:hypothetical protein
MLVYFMTIWNTLRACGIGNLCPLYIVCEHLVYFSPFGLKNLATLDSIFVDTRKDAAPLRNVFN